jgi:hypothetical protein
MKKLVILCSLSFSFSLWAQGLDQVTLEELSSSQRSIAIDRGVLEGYVEGNSAKFYLQRGDIESPKLFLIAEGELIKSLPRKSYWSIKKIHIPKAMTAGRKLLVLNSKDILRGRPLKIKNKDIVISERDYNSIDEFIDQDKDAVPARLVKVGDKYEPSADIFEKTSHREADVEISNYEVMKKKSGTRYSDEYGDIEVEKYFVGTQKIPVGDITNAEDKKLFESVSDGYLEKTNNMKYGRNGFYKDQEKLKEFPDVSKKITVNSVYDDYREDVKASNMVSPRAIAKYKRDGEMWSADMDDGTLRRYFIETGLEKEQRRRELSLNELDGNEIIIHYSGALSDHTTEEDPNYRGRGYNLGISYDLHFSRIAPDLKNWSLQFIYERGVVDYDFGGMNARSEEAVYGGYLNYYFYNNPLTLNSFIFLGGVGMKTGGSTVSSSELSKEYSYQVLSLPTFQLMTKYRFRSGDLQENAVNVGTSLNFGINLDSKNLSTIDKLDDSIYSKLSVSELRYTLGMSVYF